MSEVEVLRQQVAELMPWALYGAMTAEQYTTDVIGSAVTCAGKVVPIFRPSAINLKSRIEAGEFNV